MVDKKLKDKILFNCNWSWRFLSQNEYKHYYMLTYQSCLGLALIGDLSRAKAMMNHLQKYPVLMNPKASDLDNVKISHERGAYEYIKIQVHCVSGLYAYRDNDLEGLKQDLNKAFSALGFLLRKDEKIVEAYKIQSLVDDLYDFGGHNVMFFVKSLNEFSQNVMIFGHNHAFTSICNIFGDVFIENLPTSGLVVIDFDTNSWHDIQKGSTRFTIFPKDLK